MTEICSSDDRRKGFRFRVEGLNAVVIYQDSVVNVSMLDISDKGLAFYYEDIERITLGEECIIDLFGENFTITDTHIKINSECLVSRAKSMLSAEYLPGKRRCGAEFVKLSERQKYLISLFVTLFGDTAHFPANDNKTAH